MFCRLVANRPPSHPADRHIGAARRACTAAFEDAEQDRQDEGTPIPGPSPIPDPSPKSTALYMSVHMSNDILTLQALIATIAKCLVELVPVLATLSLFFVVASIAGVEVVLA